VYTWPLNANLTQTPSLSPPIGKWQVIKGWDEGVIKMSVGEKATLTITADFGYGARGAGGVIPPNADLIFEVELLAILG
jgi:FKBP-type peptidyl-prolyl cis-trans isomerase